MDIIYWIISIVSPIIIIGAVFGFILYLKRGTTGTFSDLYKDHGIYPSLSRFQAFLWTLVFTYVLLAVIISELAQGQPVAQIPIATSENMTSTGDDPTASLGAVEQAGYTTTLLIGALMSVAFGQGLSNAKYKNYYDISTIVDNSPRPFITMLMENGKIEITRVQLFVWTLVAIFVYLLTFSINTVEAFNNEKAIEFPEINPILLVLSGISQAGFVAGKVVIPKATEMDANPAALSEIEELPTEQGKKLPTENNS